MHIFLDESGTFSGVGHDLPAVSAQGALIIPTGRLPKLINRYQRLRANLPKRNGEVKGSQLSEAQVAAVIDLLRRNEALFCASIIDMAEHDSKDIAKHRAAGIRALEANLTDGHTPELRAGVKGLQDRMAGFSDQLYVQAQLTLDLLHRVLEEMLGYHCQRNPKELAEFHWVVDAKNPTKVTDWEDWWSATLVIWLQARSIVDPGKLLETGDFRHFQRFFFDELPRYLQAHVNMANDRRPKGIDLQKLFWESFTFSPEPEAGLELVDIITNALRRALNGNLGKSGWLPLRSLMIHRPDVYVRPMGFLSEERLLSKDLAKTLNHFRTGGRNMMVPSARN